MVTLELLGQLHPLQDHAEALFAAAMHRMSADVEAEHARARERLAAGH